jgi:hypothetical protein
LKKKKQPSAVKPTCSVVRTNFQIQTRQFDYIFGLLQLIRPNFIPTKKKKKKKKIKGAGRRTRPQEPTMQPLLEPIIMPLIMRHFATFVENIQPSQLKLSLFSCVLIDLIP